MNNKNNLIFGILLALSAFCTSNVGAESAVMNVNINGNFSAEFDEVAGYFIVPDDFNILNINLTNFQIDDSDFGNVFDFNNELNYTIKIQNLDNSGAIISTYYAFPFLWQSFENFSNKSQMLISIPYADNVKYIKLYNQEREMISVELNLESMKQSSAWCSGNCYSWMSAVDNDWGSVANDNGGCANLSEGQCISNRVGTEIYENYSINQFESGFKIESKYEIKSDGGSFKQYCKSIFGWTEFYSDELPGFPIINAAEIPKICINLNVLQIKTRIDGMHLMSPTFYYESKLSYYSYNITSAFNYISSITGNAIANYKYGDFNKDNKVNALDMAFFSSTYGSKCGQEKYRKEADANNDCKINALDMAAFSKNFGMSYIFIPTVLSIFSLIFFHKII
jgi:hypothetical protein